MRTWLFPLAIVFSLLAGPISAANFMCPAPTTLPQALNLASSARQGQGGKLDVMQAYLNNLQIINEAYHHARTRATRNQIANCLIYHLATLHDTNALQSPQTRADGATWFLLVQEAKTALAAINPIFFRSNAQVALVRRWLNAVPVYGSQTQFAVSSR